MRRLWLLGLALIAGYAGSCHRSPPKATPAATPANREPPNFCAMLHQRNLQSIGRILHDHPRRFSIAAQPVDLAQPETLLRAMESEDAKQRCLDPGSTGLLISGVELTDKTTEEGALKYSTLTLRYSVLRMQSGKEQIFRSPIQESYSCCPSDHQWPQVVRDFDYDSDGNPELLLASIKREDPSGEDSVDYQTSLSLLTLRGEQAVPYPLFSTVRFPEVFQTTRELTPDIDKDGRPDVLTWFDYYIPARCFSETGGVLVPAFALHADKTGRFSKDDAAARAFARSWCPSRPSRPLSQVPASELAQHVICARLWGASQKELASALTARCSAQNPTYTADDSFYNPGAECEDPKERGFCGPWIFTIAETPPPFSLK